jgi:hypothetical protein
MTQWNENDPRSQSPYGSSLQDRRDRRTLDRLARANANADVNDTAYAGGTPPMVTGLSLVSNVGSIHVKWSRSSISDLKTYELQIATNGDFTENVLTKSTRELEYNWEEGEDDTTYYMRVRAVNIPGNPGPWGARLNTDTGLVNTALIDVDATTQVARFVYGDDGGETFATLGSVATGDTEDYGNLTIDIFDDDAVVSPTIVFEYDYAADYLTVSATMNITFGLYRRVKDTPPWVLVNSASVDIKSSIPNIGGARTAGDTARATVPSFVNFDEPGQGEWDYMVRVTVNYTGANNYVEFTGVLLELEFWQSKR